MHGTDKYYLLVILQKKIMNITIEGACAIKRTPVIHTVGLQYNLRIKFASALTCSIASQLSKSSDFHQNFEPRKKIAYFDKSQILIRQHCKS